MIKATNSISPMVKAFGVLIPVIMIITAIILNTAFRESLFLLGVNRVYDMQSSPSSALKAIENIFSLLGNPIIVVSVLAIQFLFVKQRVRSLVHIIFLTGSLYFTFIFKQLFQQSRPFWYSDKVSILEWFCPSDFGNPSGHSFVVIPLYEPLISDFLGTGPKKVFIGIWAVIAALVMISRMYLGAHSLDQIVFGCLLGLSFLIIYKYKLRQLLYEVIGLILSQRDKIFFAVCNTVGFVIYLTLPIIIYLINFNNRPVDSSDITNINAKCNSSLSNQSMKMKSLVDTSMGFISIGFMYGILMLKNRNREDVLYFLGHWSFSSTKAIVYWVLALIGIVGVPTIILAIVIPKVAHVAIVNFISTALGATYGAFSFVYLMSVVQNRFGLIELKRGNENE